MKKIIRVVMITVFVVIVASASTITSCADFSNGATESDNNLFSNISEAEAYILYISLPSSLNDRAKEVIMRHFDAHGVDISDEDMQGLFDYIKSKAWQEEKETESVQFDNLPLYSDSFDSESSVDFPLFECVQEICRGFDYVTQIKNPEYSFDVNTQEFEHVYLYLSYYGDVKSDEAREILEEYTDQLLSSLGYSFQNVEFNVLSISWKVPSVDEESLYAASFWCKNNDGKLERGDGTGIIYQ